MANTTILAWASSLVLSIAGAWKVIEMYSPKIKKALRITEDVVKILNDFLDSASDKEITKEEIEKLLADVKHLKEELK